MNDEDGDAPEPSEDEMSEFSAYILNYAHERQLSQERIAQLTYIVGSMMCFELNLKIHLHLWDEQHEH